MNCVDTINLDDYGNKICKETKNLKKILDEYTNILEKINKKTPEDYEYYRALSTHIRIVNKLAELTDETGKLLKDLSLKIENYSGRGING